MDIGGNVCISSKLIIAVLALDNIKYGAKERTRNFFIYAQNNAKLFNVSDDIPESLVLTTEGAYLSPVRSKVIMERLAKGAKRQFDKKR